MRLGIAIGTLHPSFRFWAAIILKGRQRCWAYYRILMWDSHATAKYSGAAGSRWWAAGKTKEANRKQTALSRLSLKLKGASAFPVSHLAVRGTSPLMLDTT